MLKINGKTFMNIEEAVQWLLDNNALLYQCSANYVADTEIGLGTVTNPSPAKVKIGSLILFANGKVATVTGLTSNSFIVSSEYTDLSNIARYIVSASVDASGNLIINLSDGSSINAGLLKQIDHFAMSGSNLIAYFNDGTSQDCGAIFSGSLTLPADLTVTDDLAIGGDASFAKISTFNGNVVIATGKNLTVGGNANFQTATFNDVATFADEAIFNNPVTINDNLAIDGDISTTRDASIGGDLLVAGDTDLTGDLVVSGSINGIANPSVKPIYCHPIFINMNRTYDNYVFQGTMLIFNNDPTAFTKQTFTQYLNNLFANYPDARIMVSGFYATAPVSCLAKSNSVGQYNLYLSNTTTSGQTKYINAPDIESSDTIFSDGVNQIN